MTRPADIRGPTARRLVAAGAAILLAAGGGLAGWALADRGGSAETGHVELGAGPTLDAREFIDLMIPHHELSIEMARIARERSDAPDVRALADEIVVQQQFEIRQMRAWRAEWYPTAPPAEPHDSRMDRAVMGMDFDPEDLRDTDAIDEDFLSAMIPHHAGALVMARRALLHPHQRPELTRFATTLVEGQSQEIGVMERMRQNLATYGEARI